MGIPQMGIQEGFLIIHKPAVWTEMLLGHHLSQVDNATVAPHCGDKLELFAALGTGRLRVLVVAVHHKDVLLEMRGVDEAAAGAVAELAGKPPDILVDTFNVDLERVSRAQSFLAHVTLQSVRLDSAMHLEMFGQILHRFAAFCAQPIFFTAATAAA